MADNSNRLQAAKIGQYIALTGLSLYVVFAPHSVAGGAIAIAIASLGWIIRALSGGGLGLSWTKFDLIIALSLLWTFGSSLLSYQPAISLAKFQASWCVLIFYLTRAVLTKRSALLLVGVLIASGCLGALYSVYDMIRGRGVVVVSLNEQSPFRSAGIQPGDTIWRIARRRVYSPEDIDRTLRSLPSDTVVSVSVISRAEHVERPGLKITSAMKAQSSPSGVVGHGRDHQFRASGWTRHYQTFAEVLQMVAQLALGLALAHFRNHGPNRFFRLTLPAAALLTLGIVLTAMRSVLVAFVVAAFVIAWRSTRSAGRVIVTFALFFCLAFGSVVVWQTRAPRALLFGDDSSSLRNRIASVGISRVMLHPVFGHGMDAMKKHWREWGFPGDDVLHLHSTPLQLAFDRGLPMLLLWLWMMLAFWIYISRAERKARETSDTGSYGLLLGILGALTGFLISSLGNYNYGDSEAVMLFWWLMGAGLVLGRDEKEKLKADQATKR